MLKMKDFGRVGIERGHSVGNFQEGEVKPGMGRISGKTKILVAGWQIRWDPLVVLISGNSRDFMEEENPAAHEFNLDSPLEEQKDLGLLEAFPTPQDSPLEEQNDLGLLEASQRAQDPFNSE